MMAGKGIMNILITEYYDPTRLHPSRDCTALIREITSLPPTVCICYCHGNAGLAKAMERASLTTICEYVPRLCYGVRSLATFSKDLSSVA